MQLSIRPPWSLSPGDSAELAVVIDVLRATTTACFLCARGTEVIVLESCGDLASLGPPENYTVFSELALPPGWRHVDNSPAVARTSDVVGTPVLVTTNGTRAIHAALGVASAVALASFANIGAVAAWIRARAPQTLVLVPAGFDPRREARYEDDVCARALEGLVRGDADPVTVADAAAGCWNDARVKRRLDANPALRADVELALAPNSLSSVPVALRRGEHVVIHPGS